MPVNVVHTNKNLITLFILFFKKYEGEMKDKEEWRQIMSLDELLILVWEKLAKIFGNFQNIPDRCLHDITTSDNGILTAYMIFLRFCQKHHLLHG